MVLPTIVLLFPHYLPYELSVKMAIATALAGIYVLTAFIGANVVPSLPPKAVEVIVGIVLILVSLKLIVKNQVNLQPDRKANRTLFTVVILLAGFDNSVCGIGTGNIAINYLCRHATSH